MNIYERLKQEFTNSERWNGYDAEEDRNYFTEFLVGRVESLEERIKELEVVVASQQK